MASAVLRTIDDALIEQVVEQIVETCTPETVIMFGSGARGEAKPGSDLDLLVVLDLPENMTARQIRASSTHCSKAGCFRSTSSCSLSTNGPMDCVCPDTLPARPNARGYASMADPQHAEAANAWVTSGNHDLSADARQAPESILGTSDASGASG